MKKKSNQTQLKQVSLKYGNMNRSIHVSRSDSRSLFTDIYYDLLSMGWGKFLLAISISYFCINLIFGCIYFFSGPTGLSGQHESGSLIFFTQCFFFSVQTFSTIGYGGITPISFFTNIVVSFQALIGMLSIGLTSGLFFVRFTRPSAKIIFSEQVLITQHLGKRSLLFRLANSRINTIINAQLNVTVMMDHKTHEGMNLRLLKDLKLTRSFNAVFFLNWLVTHEIDSESPFYNLSHDDLKNLKFEVMVSFSGTDQTFSQSIHAGKVYGLDQIQYDRHFEDMLIRDGEVTKVDLDKISKLKN